MVALSGRLARDDRIGLPEYRGRHSAVCWIQRHVLEGDKLVQAHKAEIDPVPPEVTLHSHRIDVSPGGHQMMVCGGQGAALHDGEKWQVLFPGPDLES